MSSQNYAAWDFDDFLITGPGLLPIPAALNLFISGTMGGGGSTDGQGSLTSFASGGGDFHIHIEINGAVAGNGSADYVWSNGTTRGTADGLLEGHGGTGGALHTIITGEQLMLPVGQLFSVEVEASAFALASVRIMGTPADEFDALTAEGLGISDFQSTVSFPTSGPVFNLPPGYTVNSVSAGVVNNAVVPEPSALWLLMAGAGGVWAARRRFSGAR